MTELKKLNVKKLTNSKCEKIQKLNYLKESFSKNNLTPGQPMRCTQGSLLRSCDVSWLNDDCAGVMKFHVSKTSGNFFISSF